MHQLNFVPPGPGVWELESTHIMRPVSRAMEAFFPDAATAGFFEGMARYGMLLDGMEFKVVNRFVYTALRPVGAPKGAKGPPPKFIFKLLTKLHPQVRRRLRTLDETWATKRWREDVKRSRAIEIVMGEMFAVRDKQASAAKISGHAASPGEIVGVARLVLDPQDMARVRKGDVLITRSTAPSYNALLPLLSGIVTDRGGTLSHAAVVAREYGIPAVVGTGNATELIRDGVRVRVDGARGTVEVLA